MSPSTEKMVEALSELIRLDYDAIGEYTTAIADVVEEDIRDPLARFREDHERHVTVLSTLVRDLGGTPPESPDLKGLLRRTMTKVAGLSGTKGTLEAMKSNEGAVAETYSHHLAMAWPPATRRIIESNYADERRHLAWVENTLSLRTWDGPLGDSGASAVSES